MRNKHSESTALNYAAELEREWIAVHVLPVLGKPCSPLYPTPTCPRKNVDKSWIRFPLLYPIRGRKGLHVSGRKKPLSLRRDVLPPRGLPAHLHLSAEEEGDRFHTTRRPARFFTSDESFQDTGETKRPPSSAPPPILNGGGEIMIIMARRSLLNSGPEFLGKRASERARERMMRPPERKAGRKRENVADSIQPPLMQWGATTQHNGNRR